MMVLLALKSGVAVFLTILCVLVAVPLIWLLYRGVMKDRARFADAKLSSNNLTQKSFDELLMRRFRMAGKRTAFACMRIEIHDAQSQAEAFGETGFKNAVLALTTRIEKVFPNTAKVCRYAYDTITVLIDHGYSAEELSDFASFVILECKKPVEVAAGLVLEADVNVGVCQYNEFSNTYPQFWSNLEFALVESKRSGVNSFVLYTAELVNRESEEYKYYREIKEAIERNEFTLFYQPIVDIRTGDTVALESLLRWNHRTLGILPPSKFINIIEQTGDINWVGMWAYEQLLKQKRVWEQKFPEHPVLLTMNLSPKQLSSEELVDELRRIARKYRVLPREICFEIVEFALFDKMGTIRSNLEKMKAAGFTIAIDDYDLERNTFAMLEQVKVDYVKLERKFIESTRENMVAEGLVKTLVQYAQENRIQLVAEGIEDEQSVAVIRDMGIFLGQGYYYSRPVDPREILL